MLIKLISLTIALIFASYYNNNAIKIYYSGQTRGDLTNFSQAMYNSTQGRYMQNTFNYSLHNFWGGRELEIPINSSIFGIHFNPILTIFIPLYTSPASLITIQSYLLCLSSFLVFLFAYNKKITLPGFVAQLLFLTNPALVSAIYSEFHAYALGVFFVGLFLYFSETKQNHTFTSLAFVFAILVQENIPISIGIYCILKTITSKKYWKYYLILSTISLFYFYLTIKVIIPNLSNYHAYIFESIYGNNLGGSFLEMIKNSIQKPTLLSSILFSKENRQYILDLTRPTLLSIFSPTMYLSSLATLSASIISSSSLLKSQSMHYESIFLSFAYFGWVTTVSKVNNKNILFSFLLASISLISLKTNLDHNWQRNNGKISNIKPFPKELKTIQDIIPSRASLSTQDHLSVFFTNRRELYLFPVYAVKSDFVLLSKKDIWPLTTDEQKAELAKLSKTHGIKSEDSNYLLLQSLLFN